MIFSPILPINPTPPINPINPIPPIINKRSPQHIIIAGSFNI